MVPCPRCRGYNLERQWCDLCDGAGQITAQRASPTRPAIPVYQTILDRAKTANNPENQRLALTAHMTRAARRAAFVAAIRQQ